MEDDWGEPASKSKKTEKEEKEKSSAPMNAKAETEKKKEEEEKKRREMFFGGDNKELDDLPTIGEGNTEKQEDKFNQVLSTSKENGGLLASIGLKKGEGNDESIIDDSQEEDPHKKSDLFDTSKDKIAKGGKVNQPQEKGIESDEDEFDLGFGSNKKGKEKIAKKGSDSELGAPGMGSDEEDMTEE